MVCIILKLVKKEEDTEIDRKMGYEEGVYK